MVEHDSLGFKWRSRCHELPRFVTAFVRVDFTRYQPRPAIWMLRVSFIAHDPAAASSNIVRLLVHIIDMLKLPDLIVEVPKFVDNRSLDLRRVEDFAGILVNVPRPEILLLESDNTLPSIYIWNRR